MLLYYSGQNISPNEIGIATSKREYPIAKESCYHILVIQGVLNEQIFGLDYIRRSFFVKIHKYRVS